MWGVSSSSSSNNSRSDNERDRPSRPDQTKGGKRSKNTATLTNEKLLQPIFYDGGTTSLEKIQATANFINGLELKPDLRCHRVQQSRHINGLSYTLKRVNLIRHRDWEYTIEFYGDEFSPEMGLEDQKASICVDVSDRYYRTGKPFIVTRIYSAIRSDSLDFDMIEIAYPDYFNNPDIFLEIADFQLPVTKGVLPDDGRRLMDVANDMLRYAIRVPDMIRFYPTNELNNATVFPVRSNLIGDQLIAAYGFMINLFANKLSVEAKSNSGEQKYSYSELWKVRLQCHSGIHIDAAYFGMELHRDTGLYDSPPEYMPNTFRPGRIDTLLNTKDSTANKREYHNTYDDVYLTMDFFFQNLNSTCDVTLKWEHKEGGWQMTNMNNSVIKTTPVGYIGRELQRASRFGYTGSRGMQVISTMQRSRRFNILGYLMGNGKADDLRQAVSNGEVDEKKDDDNDYDKYDDDVAMGTIGGLEQARTEFEEQKWKCKHAVYRYVLKTTLARNSLLQKESPGMDSLESMTRLTDAMRELRESVGNGLVG